MAEESLGKPLCFVLMPFGKKDDPTGRPQIDFDRIYHQALAPAIADAGMVAIRADEERIGGIIHKPMFERLLLCEYAIADMTTANANVFYELGVRHAARPGTTLPIFATQQPIPFDVNLLRALPYELGPNNRFDDNCASALRTAVSQRLDELRQGNIEGAVADSPVFQLLDDWTPGDIARLKTDVFREQAYYSTTIKERLTRIRNLGKVKDNLDQARAELDAVKTELGQMDGVERGVIVDLMLSYRALEDWDGMIELYEIMPEDLKRQIMIREQRAFAINRRAGTRDDSAMREAEREQALEILRQIEEQQGPNSETCGLIGRIYKDRWNEAASNDPLLAGAHLRQAIDAYRRGFRSDPRDAYPGINAVTLLDIKGDEASLKEKDKLIPVVRFAVENRLEGKTPDYWDYATMLELAVLANKREEANDYLGQALTAVRENWERRSTGNNLKMIQRARAERGADSDWLEQIIGRLLD